MLWLGNKLVYLLDQKWKSDWMLHLCSCAVRFAALLEIPVKLVVPEILAIPDISVTLVIWVISVTLVTIAITVIPVIVPIHVIPVILVPLLAPVILTIPELLSPS